MPKSELKYVTHNFYLCFYDLFFVPCFFLRYESKKPAITAITIITIDSIIPIKSMLTIDTVIPMTPIAASTN